MKKRDVCPHDSQKVQYYTRRSCSGVDCKHGIHLQTLDILFSQSDLIEKLGCYNKKRGISWRPIYDLGPHYVYTEILHLHTILINQSLIQKPPTVINGKLYSTSI